MDLKKFLTAFEYSNISRTFPFANNVRTGVLLIYNKKILLVRERSSRNVGPPKGLVDWSVDKTVFDAAIRKLFNETGINLKNKTMDICTNIYMYPRQYCREVIIYFAVFINFHPRLYLRNGVDRHIWADLTKGLCDKFDCSESSDVIFRAIDNSLLYKCQNTIHVSSYEKFLRAPQNCKNMKPVVNQSSLNPIG